MKQNINLLPHDTAASGPVPAASLVIATWIALFMMLAGAQLWIDSRTASARQHNLSVREQLTEAESRLNMLTAADMAGQDNGLEQQLSELLAELDLRETVLELVSGGAAGDIDGYSAQIRSLARQHTEGVWLTRVGVAAPGARTTLQGKALSPEFVPLYLRGLSSQQPLSGQRFDRFEIIRPEEPGEPVEFALNRIEHRGSVQ